MGYSIVRSFEAFGKNLSEFESQHKNAAIIYTLLSSLFYVFVGIGVKMLHDFSSSQILYFRSSISLVMNTVFMQLGHYSPYAKTKEVHKLLLTRCLFGGIGHYCYYKCMHILDVSDAMTIFQTYPFFTTILAYFILKEVVTKILFVSLGLGFIGILLVVKPTFIKEMFGIPIIYSSSENEYRMFGFFNGAIYSFCMSVVMIAIRKLSGSVHNSIVIHYALISGVILSSIDMIHNQSFKYEIFEPRNFAWVVFVAIFNYVAQMIYSRAIIIEKATKIIPFTYSMILFGFIIDVMIFDKNLNMLSIIGASLIISGNLFGLKAK